MYRIKPFVNQSILKTLYFSLIYSHLQYGITAWGNCTKTNLKKLSTLKNKAITLISNAPFATRTTYLYYNLELLKLEDIYKLEVGKIKHQYVNKNLPGSFDDFFISSSNVHSHNTRRSRNNYFLPRYTSSLAIGSVRYQGVIV